MNIQKILEAYNLKDLSIAVLGGHSGLDVCHGAKKHGFKTVAVCQKGREKTYAKYFKSNNGKGCVDEIILVDKFEDVVQPEIQKKLRDLNAIFIHNRYFWVYFKDFDRMEKEFAVPIFGLREGVKLEERHVEKNQYYLLERAGIRIPKILRKGNEKLSKEELEKRLRNHFMKGGGPLIVKANEAIRSFERAFFMISKMEDYFMIDEMMIKSGRINREDLDKAVIEEYIIGAHVNLNFFYSPLSNQLELLGTDTRRQTNLDGFLRLTADEQLMLISRGFVPKMIETGHYSVTMKESLLEKAFEIGEKFVNKMKEEAPPGIIGPFALQGSVVAEEGREDFIIFDVSMRIPGSPGTKFTPYSGYLYGDSISYGERIGMEIAMAAKSGELLKLLT